ncbi:MAG: hypothetical protein ABL949_12385 [Fimbriimonadaceae bacterium]
MANYEVKTEPTGLPRDPVLDRAIVALILSGVISRGPYLLAFVLSGRTLTQAYENSGLPPEPQNQISSIVGAWLWVSLVVGSCLYLAAWWFTTLGMRSWEARTRKRSWLMIIALLALGAYGVWLTSGAPTVQMLG